MKVCMISSIQRVDDTRAVRIRRALREAGHEVVAIMGPGADGIALQDGSAYIPLPRVTRYFWSGSRLGNLAAALLMRGRNGLVALVKAFRQRPDVCICCEPDSWVVGLMMKLLTKASLVVDLQEIYETRSNAFPSVVRAPTHRAIRGAMALLSRHTDRIIHVSDTRAEYCSYLKAPSVVISNFPSLEDFAANAPERGPDLAGKFVVLHAGALRPNYAGKEFLEAIEQSAKVVPNLVGLVLGGAAGLGEEASRRLEKLENEHKIIVRPHLPLLEVVQYMKMSDVGVSLVLEVDANHQLAFPRKLFEYMAAGLAVIGSDVCDVRRVIREGQCGLVVDASSPSTIAGAIAELATHPEMRKRMAASARRAAETSYNWRCPSHKLQALFSEIEAIREGHALA